VANLLAILYDFEQFSCATSMFENDLELKDIVAIIFMTYPF